MSKTHYLQHALLNWLRGTAFPAAPATLSLGLLTASPGDAGSTASEVAGSGYARQALAFGAPADGANGSTITSTGAVTFPAATGAGWGTVSYCAVFDASVGGNMLMYAALPAPLAVAAGYVVAFPAGNITDLEQ